jgi:serine/threonine protein kinase
MVSIHLIPKIFQPMVKLNIKDAIQDRSKDYNTGVLIGEGSYGEVYQSQVPGRVIKRFLYDKHDDLNGINPTIFRESQVFGRFGKQAGLVPGSIHETSQGRYIIDMPKAACTLTKHALSISFQHRVCSLPSILFQVLNSLSHMHSLGICHRDIKLDNILYAGIGNRVWLADFGLSRSIAPGEMSNLEFSSLLCHNREAEEYSEKLDIAMLGSSMLAFLFKQYRNIDEWESALEETDFFIPEPNGDYPLQDLFPRCLVKIISMIDRDPDKRPSAKNAIIDIYGEKSYIEPVSLQPLAPLFVVDQQQSRMSDSAIVICEKIIHDIGLVFHGEFAVGDAIKYATQTIMASIEHVFDMIQMKIEYYCMAVVNMCLKVFFAKSVDIWLILRVFLNQRINEHSYVIISIVNRIIKYERMIFELFEYKFPYTMIDRNKK